MARTDLAGDGTPARGLSCLLTLGLLLSSLPATALQLPFATFSIEKGLPQSQVSALACDGRGALWVGTLGGGLSRFDGNAFLTYTRADGLSDNRVTALARDPEGRLWIGTERGLSVRDATGLRALPRLAPPDQAVRALLATRGGELWVGTENALLRLDRRTLSPIPGIPGLAGIGVSALLEDRTGRVWVGTSNRGVARFDQGQLTFLEPGVPHPRVRSLLRARDGRLWIATDAGVFVRDGERETAFPLVSGEPEPVVHALLEDHSGALWLGTERGLARYRDGSLAWFSKDDGLGASVIWALALDLEGSVWVGTYPGGLSRYQGFERLAPVLERELGDATIRSVLQDRRGRLWFGTDDRGAASFDGGRLRWLRARDGLSDDFVLTMLEDRHGTLWFGTLEGLSRLDGRGIRRFGRADGLPGGVVRSLVEDRSGVIWAGTSRGVARREGPLFRLVATGGEAGEDPVNVLYVDDAGRPWAGTSRGLSVLDGDHFTHVSDALGLPDGSVYSIQQEPRSGDLWLGMYGRGLVRLPHAALVARKAGESPRPEVLTGREVPGADQVVSLIFDRAGDLWIGTELGVDLLHLHQIDSSGLPSVSHWGSPLGPERIECIHNAAVTDHAGRVWMGTRGGPLGFDPRWLDEAPAPLRVTLTAAGPGPGDATWLPGGGIATGAPLPRRELGSDEGRAAFGFEAISLSAPSWVRYQFRLEGYDATWSPVTSSNQAFYPRLPPGDFEFRVRATRDGRTWFESPQPFRLRVLAPLWRRAWFQVLGLAALAFLLYGGHAVAVARLDSHRRALEREIRERARAERTLARTNRALRVLGECNQVLVRATDESQLLGDACRVVVDAGGYQLAWVGRAEEDAERTVRPVAAAGVDEEYVASAQVSWGDGERGRGPTGVAIRTGRPAVARDLAGHDEYGPWREEATARGLRSSIAVPIAREGRVFGALNIYASEVDAFYEQEVELISELANDLAYGLDALRTRREHERAEEALRQSEVRFRTLAETSVSGIFTYGEDDRFNYVNPALERMTGYPASELVGRDFWSLLPPQTRQLVDARRAARSRGEPVPGRFQVAFRNRAGEERWIDLGIGFVQSQGGWTGVATAFDITEQVHAEAAAHERARLATFAADVATALTRGGSLREMLQRCCEALVEHLDAALGRVFTLDEGSDVLELQASAGLYTHIDGPHGRIPVGRLEVGLVALNRRPHLTNAVAGDPFVPDQDWVRREGLVSFAGHPLVVEGRLVGVIAMFARRPLSEATQQALEAAANVVASAVLRKRAEEARLRSERRFRALIEHSSDLVSVLDSSGHVVYASPSTARVLGAPPEQHLGRRLEDLVHPEDRAHARSLVQELLEEGGQGVTGEVRLRDGSGEWRWLGVTGRNLLSEPAVAGLVLNLRDVTAQKQADAQMQHDALHDALTGMPNRALLVERLERAATRSRRYPERRFAVLFLDLDGFKFVNDSLGHETGDRLLVALAPRIEGCLRSSDTCARLGGDEFVVLLDEVGDVAGAVDVAERIQQQVSAPFAIEGREVQVSASIGIVIGGATHQRAEDILRDADIAMYRAKARGRSRHEIFDVEMRRVAVARLALETALRQAVDQQRLRVFYQPIVTLQSGRLAGFEALVRWQDPERGLVLPGEFVPVAEEGALIVSIDRWVLREACRQLRAWRASLPAARELNINVNVSSRHFTGSHLAQEIQALLGEFELDAPSLELEITESTIMDNVPVATSVLDELQGLGVRLAIDDFGTGYSSLAYLVRLPVDTLKIDRSFVGHLDRGGSSGEIVGTIVTLAHSLGMSVIAEGVETAPQRRRLRGLGCEQAQGHLISRPLSPEDAGRVILSEGRRRRARHR
jgi:diguanylate cyclase (GGDEF)-like protein/PAS domain S-box-containing protein